MPLTVLHNPQGVPIMTPKVALHLRLTTFLLLVILSCVRFAVTAEAQASPAKGRPILFAHGYCSSANDWSYLSTILAGYAHSNSPLYSNTHQYTVYYDATADDGNGGKGVVKQWPTGQNLLDGSVPEDARFFSINFADPAHLSDPYNFSPLNVAQVSILNKADELAHVTSAITALTHVKDILIFGHSMGGLDARAYLQNVARPSLSMCTDDPSNPYSCVQSPPTLYTQDVFKLVTVDTPHGGVNTAKLGSIVAEFDLDSSTCYFPYNLDARELAAGARLITYLQSTAYTLPASLTLNSIESYTWPGLMDPSVLDDGAVTYDEQSFATSIRNYSSPPSEVNDVSNGWYPLTNEMDCLLGLDPPALLHQLNCLELQSDTIAVLENELQAALNNDPPAATTSITVQATLDGVAWSGSINYQVQRSDGKGEAQQGNRVPFNFYDFSLGEYEVKYISGGPNSSPQIYPTKQSLGVDHTTGGNTWNLNHYPDEPPFTMAFCSSTCPSPTATTVSASKVVSDGAVLNGTVNPNGGATTAWFEWSKDSKLQSPQSTPAQPFGTGSSPVPVTFQLSGLEPSTTYYFALAASTGSGGQPQIGAILSFTTLSPLPAPTLLTPTDNAVNVSTPPIFSWTAVQSATSYRLIIATNIQALPTDPSNPNCGAGCVMNTTPGGNSYIPAQILAPSTTYYWEVHARSQSQFGTWSPIFTFTTAAPSLIGLSIVPSTIPSGGSSTVTATLNGSAPSGGVLVGLSSTNQAAFPVGSISIPSGANTGSITVQAGAVSNPTTVTVTANYNNSFANATVTVNPLGGSGVVLSSLSVDPPTIVGGFSPLGVVYLTGPAPAGGAQVQLSSNNQHFVQVQPSVTVKPGYTNAAFSITTSFTTAPVGATIQASYNNTEYGATVTILPVAVSGLTFYPSTVTAGSPASFTVYLNGPAPAGAIMSLTSSNPSVLQVPSNVSLPTGALSIPVSATTSAVATQTAVTVTAIYNGSSGQGCVTVVPLTLNGLSISPLTITGGNNASGTVWISSPAPAGGAAVTLSSSSQLVQVPSTVTVPAGAVSSDFTVSTSPVGSINNATVTASYGGVYDSITLTLVPPLPFVSSLSMSPSTVPSGSPSYGTVTLTAPAPLGGLFVLLTSTASYAIANVPYGVIVPDGATSATFTVTTSPISFIAPATITASYNNTQQSAVLIVAPPGTPLAPASLTLSPSSVTGGAGSTGSILLTGLVPEGGVVLTLSSDNANVVVPSILAVPPGVNSAQFTVNTSLVSTLSTATITSSLNEISQSSLLTIKPTGTPPPNNPVPFIAAPLIPLTSTPGGNGLVLSLDGAGFVSGAQVFWNGTPLPTTFLSAAHLQASVPATDVQTNQTALVTAVNPGPVSPSSNVLPEHLSYPTSASSFNSSSITASGEAAVVATGDFNRDGKLDLVVGKYDGSGLSVFLGTGDGTFGPELVLNAVGGSYSIAVGDVNGDGKPDIVVNKSYNKGVIGVFLGNGDGTFTQAADISVPTDSNSALALGDFNGDGNLDIAVTAGYPNTGAYVLLGNGDGTFKPPTNVGSVTQPRALAVADFNGDGKMDLAVADFSNQSVAILFGNGDGTFQSQIEYPTNGYATALIAADLNGDGSVDIAVANAGPVGGNGAGFGVLLNKGNGTFAAPVNYGLGQAFDSIAADDLNGDGRLDVIVADPPSQQDLIFLGNGDGTFAATPLKFPVGTNPDFPTIADLNGDGAPDIIVPSYTSGSGNITILFQSISPVLAVTPLSLSFTATQGGGTPPPSSIQITNTGGGTENWTASSSQSWLTLSESSGTAPSQITANVNPSGLNPGIYNATITVLASGAANSPQTVTVTLTINPAQVFISSLTFNPAFLIGPGSSTGTVTLTGLAPSGGATVTLSSNNPAVQVPPTMTVPAGASYGTFTAPALGVQSETIATVTATYNQVFTTATLTVEPTSSATFTLLHNFSGVGDGASPRAGLSIDAAGNLYGTTFSGGSGNGTVFKLVRTSSGWLFNPLYSFKGGTDGAGSVGRIIFGRDGSLYGTTEEGGGGACTDSQQYNGCGTVFNLKPQVKACKTALCPWTETVLYRFAGNSDGVYPNFGDLVVDQASNIYGVTSHGGLYGNCPSSGNSYACGTAYKLTRSGGSWNKTTLYNFGQNGDGAVPLGGLALDSTGKLYGTTFQGGSCCGTVFQLTPSGSGWTENILYSFQGSSDGGSPHSGLILDQSGNLYGATTAGGAYDGGTAFKLTPSGESWTFTALYGFNAFTGSGPFASLVMDKAGNLYGTTYAGGANARGSVFKLMPSSGGWLLIDLHDFTGGSDGGYVYGNLVLDANGNLYGTASAGGSSGHGVVFEITP
jgi:uncharacterized repeat protein (TIGR03803 family)